MSLRQLPAGTRVHVRLFNHLDDHLPEAVVGGAVVAGWSVLLASSTVAVGGVSGALGDHGRHVLVAMAMAPAMMAPLAWPLALGTAAASLHSQRCRTVPAAVAFFVGLWAALCVFIHGLVDIVARLVTAPLLAAACVSLIGWQLATGRRRDLLNRCQVSVPIRPGSATPDALARAAAGVLPCILLCGAPMALVSLRPAPLLIAAATLLSLAERVSVPPRPAALAIGWATLATVAVLST